MFDAYTGAELVDGLEVESRRGVRLGLEPPRYCAQCGRWMIVQVVPDRWWARCSRHGIIDSHRNEQR
ncbi:hypothetical protein ACIBED_18890 [Rhodococcus coprophilus]|uniref:biotin synthase auxiliary protein BsaP n=1 Tax=Rhodococcus coprophilus TaxID=38310 RepID=UPI0009326632|nr:hypothetical protein [Rhodococcus coprophilus]MBM7460572.1 hypothetical protein [Rhodococcus coprophilus]